MGITAGLFPFSAWEPDISDLNTKVSANIVNVIPRGDGYGPFSDFVAFTSALALACRGFFFARNGDGSVTIFAATSARIYVLNNTTFTWTDISKGGADYTGLTSDRNWQFVQFNLLVIAVQVGTAPQVVTLNSNSSGVTGNFADLGGSPPQAAFVAIVNRFVVLAGIFGFPYRVQWSGLNATTTWDNVTSQSNFQDLADGGRVTGLAGGDQFGVIFQDSAVRSMIFAPGSAVVFDVLKIATNDGLLSPYAAVNAADKIYFVSPQGFKVIAPGGYPEAIGKEKVDRTFFADVDTANFQLLQAATDPSTTRVYWAYKSLSGQSGMFDKIIVYDRVLARWAVLKMSGEYLAALSRPGLTIEGLDAIAPGVISITGAANNGSGAIRLTISGLTAGSGTGQTNLNNENTVEVYGVTGTTEANGNWKFTIVNSTHIDLTGSTFSNAYVSGGSIGGSLDQLAFSLDTISLASLAQLAMVGSTHALGFFTGSNLEGQMETPEEDGNGKRFFIHNIRPMTDCPSAAVSVAARDTAQAALVYTGETTVNDIGSCPVQGGGIDARYARVKLRTPYGAVWTYAMGVEPEFRFTGTR